MSIIADPAQTPDLSSVPAVLRALADRMDAMTCYRVTPANLYGVLNSLTLTNTGFVLRTEAIDALVAHWKGGTGDDQWLNGWTGPRRRVDIVHNIRAAARVYEVRQALAAAQTEPAAAVA